MCETTPEMASLWWISGGKMVDKWWLRGGLFDIIYQIMKALSVICGGYDDKMYFRGKKLTGFYPNFSCFSRVW